jgi:hypothetical protein
MKKTINPAIIPVCGNAAIKQYGAKHAWKIKI